MRYVVRTLIVWVCVVPLVGGCLARGAGVEAPPAEMELATLQGQLADPARSAKTKQEAAALLLARTDPHAKEVLLGFLTANDNPSAQIAIAEAIAAAPAAPREFLAPLLEVLRTADPSVRPAAARALVRQRDEAMTEQLITLARDRSAEESLRLDVIAALSGAPDKRTVEALVALLDAPAAPIRAAAAESLTKLTNIRAFGDDAAQWRQWWQANKDKDRSAWLADLADSLARAKAALQADNDRLRERLVRTMSDLYDATPATQRETMLATLLQDDLPDVRLVALRLVDRRIASNEPVSPEIRAAVRTLLTDGDARIRRLAAILVASLTDSEALEALLDRLAVEDSPEVRAALLRALGQLREGEALPAVVKKIGSPYDDVAAAAAVATVRIAEKVPLDEDQRTDACEIISSRYEAIDPSAAGGVVLREALLSAMGAVGEQTFVPVLQEALKDPSAKVRLAAASSLARVAKSAAAPALAELLSDSDRGVRQAAIAALGTVGGVEYLSTILNLTDPAVEPDALVRRQAWEVVVTLLAQADEETISNVAETLAAREDTLAQRIQVLELLVERLKPRGGSALGQAQRRLGEALMQAQRPAEAAAQLGQAYAVYVAAEDAKALAVWNEWLDALLAANDPACIDAIAEQTDDRTLATALRKLTERLSELDAEGQYPTVIRLAEEAMEQLRDRMSQAQYGKLQALAERAQATQQAMDARKVATLVPLLVGEEESARKAAAELEAMSTRAVGPLLTELRTVVTSETANPEIELAIVEVLRQISPTLTGYDPSAPVEDKLKRIDAWSQP